MPVTTRKMGKTNQSTDDVHDVKETLKHILDEQNKLTTTNWKASKRIGKSIYKKTTTASETNLWTTGKTTINWKRREEANFKKITKNKRFMNLWNMLKICRWK